MWLPADHLTFLPTQQNADFVWRLFTQLITELEHRPLAEVIGLDEGDSECAM